MSENQSFALFCVFVVVTRIPRILERWKAPLLRGPEWFFNVAVTADFWKGPGAAILRNYRWHLFTPWAVELPVCGAILAAGLNRWYIAAVIFVVTLLTRVNYYVTRKSAEDRARLVTGAVSNERPVTVALSLEPRTLRQYTNWWIEASILLAMGGPVAWLALRYGTTPDHHVLRGVFIATVLAIYLQIGLLMMKRAFVRARVVAPAEDAEQYLAWRDSLRRLSTAICDYIRVGWALIPLGVMLMAFNQPWQGSTAQKASAIGIAVLTLIAVWYEWKKRLEYLAVARRTKPANFLVLPDVPDAGKFVFRPSLPVLLLSSPGGYALNLASAPAKVAGIYVAGFAALLILLTR